jgi:L-asparaginase II
MNENPVIAEITRGSIVESRHRGSFVVCDADGNVIIASGDITTPVYPRSAIKAFQCLPVIESGAADRFGLTDEEIALCCASHYGEQRHVEVARSILAKTGHSESHYQCGPQWPSDHNAARDLVRSGQTVGQIHNNCSGKHAGMLALASHLGAEHKNYIALDHPVQQSVAATLTRLCDIDLKTTPVGIDGCSVPTWAMPLRNTAMGFARFLALPVAQRIISAVRSHAFMIAGTDTFDTDIMQAVPRLFIKYGAEAVYCGCIPHAGLGFAMKCDDGSQRAIEVAAAALLVKLDVWTTKESASLSAFKVKKLLNRRKIEVGEIRATI